MKQLIAIWIGLVAAVVAHGQGTTQFEVLPIGFANQEGNDGTTIFLEPSDHQQLWRGDYLAQTWTTPVAITEIAFRVEGGARQ